MTHVLVLLGTDHHPFERLVDWADQWRLSRPNSSVLVQHGHTRPPRHAEGVAFLSPDELRRQVLTADIVITHGGPGTMSDALNAGRQPVLVPRNPQFGEHVDDHQMRFGRWVGTKGLVTLATDTAELDAIVEAELASPSRPQAGIGQRSASAAAELGRLLTRPSPVGPVVFIAGAGRSGSTILERVLGQDPRVVALGEVLHLWERGVTKNESCGCRAPFRECEFWDAVGQRAFGGWDQVDLRDVRSLANKVDRQRRIPKTMLPALSPTMRTLTRSYASYYRRIYRAALEVSGRSIVIDSGKHPSLAFALSHDPDIDLRVLHVVRDSMGVAHSWSKSVRRPEATRDEDLHMARYSPLQSGLMWVTTNLEVELLRSKGLPFARLIYEEFVADPATAISRAWRALGLRGAAPDLVDDDRSINLDVNHTAAGNPARFKCGLTHLHADRTWTRDLPARDRRMVSLLTGPLRTAYGYGQTI